jgi:hypothetical protein
MKRGTAMLFCCTALSVIAAPALAHGCEPDGESNRYLIGGHYHGGCDVATELAHGHGEAKGADAYVGNWVNGKPDGRGVYTWEKGGRLDGSFSAGLADGPGVYVSAKGVRYEGTFTKGRLGTLKPEDCPATRGPLNC